MNVLSFAAVVPGYYYLAIRNHYKPRNLRITYGNEHDVDNGGPAAIEGKPFPSLLSSESSSRCMEDIYDTEHPRCNDNHQDDHMLRLQSELSENEQKTLKRQTIVPFLAEISTSCSNVDVCTEDDKANINCNIRSTPILSVTQQSEVFEEPVQQQANIEEASVSQQFLICFLFTVTILSGGLSWYYRIIYLSAVSFVFSMAAAASMNIYQWPHPNEKIMIPQFLWHLLVLCGNNKLPLVYQISLSLYALCYASFVVTHPPYTLKDTFPILFGSTGKYNLT